MSLSCDERHIVEALGEVWKLFVLLPVEHPNDSTEFCRIIHEAQEKVLSRPARREMMQNERS